MHTGRDMPTSPAAVMATLRSAQAKGPGSALLPTHSNAAASVSAGVNLSLLFPCAVIGHFQPWCRQATSRSYLSRRKIHATLRLLACKAARDNAHSNAPHCWHPTATLVSLRRAYLIASSMIDSGLAATPRAGRLSQEARRALRGRPSSAPHSRFQHAAAAAAARQAYTGRPGKGRARAAAH